MDLITKAKGLSPNLRIGKASVTDNMVEEIKNQLRVRDMIKIKILKSALDTKSKREIIDEISDKTKGKLIMEIGNVFVIYKKYK